RTLNATSPNIDYFLCGNGLLDANEKCDPGLDQFCSATCIECVPPTTLCGGRGCVISCGGGVASTSSPTSSSPASCLPPPPGFVCVGSVWFSNSSVLITTPRALYFFLFRFVFQSLKLFQSSLKLLHL